MKNYELRLQLIQAKCQLMLNDNARWHQEVSKGLFEILQEAQKAYDEVKNDRSWEAGDR